MPIKKTRTKPLFDIDSDFERWNEDGSRIGKQAQKLLEPFVSRVVRQGYSGRQLQQVIETEVAVLISIALLERSSKERSQR